MVLAAKTCPARLIDNAGETGYYLVNYKGDLLNRLLSDQGRHLGIAERVGVLGDVEALVSTGDYSPGTALGLVPDFAADPNWQVVEAAAGLPGIVQGDGRLSVARSKRTP